jgi:hypothetical protein
MTDYERQVIRAYHVAIVAYCQCCESICRECSAEYPCDAIRLLDATDTQRQAITNVLALGYTDAAELRDAILKVLK